MLLQALFLCYVYSCYDVMCFFFFSSRRRHTRSVSAFLLNRSSDLHFMRTLPTGSVDPNFGRRVRNRRQLNSLQNTWPYGYSMPIAVRTRRTLFHVLVGCGLLMLKVSRLKLPVIWLLVSMWLNTLTKSQIWTLLLKV